MMSVTSVFCFTPVQIAGIKVGDKADECVLSFCCICKMKQFFLHHKKNPDSVWKMKLASILRSFNIFNREQLFVQAEGEEK